MNMSFRHTYCVKQVVYCYIKWLQRISGPCKSSMRHRAQDVVHTVSYQGYWRVPPTQELNSCFWDPRFLQKSKIEEQTHFVPHVQHFLGVSVERHKLVWVFDPYGHTTAGLFHFVSFHPLTRQGRRVRGGPQASGYPTHQGRSASHTEL